ncbi:PEP-CTERM sorting domain-containing protein [Aeoliella sp. ICT_H6.2]|uniref:PEP-CTERM sorting domain-containing protein n=1 Tax=Aeoliella straminimaris TaxID=2954799 RepID=A0A9X2FIL0_9BACT|nr:PEP-CTERM sorting domain-containing protein [Aeoliella straminimaris]MCO6046126.1 PEP-CTERM sorting domain-containing protein [Aeoliella straminimaris]
MTISLHKLTPLVAAVALTTFATLAHANTMSTMVTIDVLPNTVPDEELPRNHLGDAPIGLGPDSWQGPATGKSNWHARFQADGDYLTTLFPDEAATMTINDIANISYYTKRPTGTPAGRDWWIQIYTRPDGVDDTAGWYGYKVTNNYHDHTDIGNWVEYSTFSDMTFSGGPLVGENTLAEMQSDIGSELVEMISVQTDSGWNGFDGYIDGLRIELQSGSVGIVNFQAVPEPASIALVGVAAVAGLAIYRRRAA